MKTNSYLDFEINYGRIAMKMLWYDILTISILPLFFTSTISRQHRNKSVIVSNQFE